MIYYWCTNVDSNTKNKDGREVYPRVPSNMTPPFQKVQHSAILYESMINIVVVCNEPSNLTRHEEHMIMHQNKALNNHTKTVYITQSQNKEDSSDTVYCSICSPQTYVSQRRRARGGNFLISFINIKKYTSVSENVHLCLSQNSQLGHISVATGRIPSLFCDAIDGWSHYDSFL